MIEFISPLAGAFFGALAAFLSEALRRKREEKEKRYEAILSTQAALLSQANSMLSIHQQIEAAPATNPFENLKHMLLRFSQQTVDFHKLTFLASSSAPYLLLDIEVAQESFRFAVDMIDLRNKLLDKFFDDPRTEIKEFSSSTGQIRASGDPRLTMNLRMANEGAFKAILHAQKSNKHTRDCFYAFAKKKYPKKKLLFVAEEARPTQLRNR